MNFTRRYADGTSSRSGLGRSDTRHSGAANGCRKLASMSTNRIAEQGILVYATSWCGDCRLARRVLYERQVGYTCIDIDRDPSAVDLVLRLNGGYRTVPTIIFLGGRVLVEPTRRELEDALTESESAV